MHPERQALIDYLSSAPTLSGVDELGEADIITAGVVVLRVERADEQGAAVLVACTTDWVTQRGLLAIAADEAAFPGGD